MVTTSSYLFFNTEEERRLAHASSQRRNRAIGIRLANHNQAQQSTA